MQWLELSWGEASIVESGMERRLKIVAAGVEAMSLSCLFNELNGKRCFQSGVSVHVRNVALLGWIWFQLVNMKTPI